MLLSSVNKKRSLRQSPFLSRKKKVPYLELILLYCVVLFATKVISEYDALDLAHYIVDADLYMSLSLTELISTRIEWGKPDFIYFIFLTYAVKHSFVILMTATTVFVYYLLVIKQMNNICRNKIELFVYIAVLFIAPITWTCAMARNLMAFLFLYCSIIFIFKEKKIISLLFALLGILTHFSVLMYVIVLIGAYFCQDKRLRPGILLAILVLVTTISLLVPSTFYDIIRLFLSEDSGFYHYTESTMTSFWAVLSYGDSLPAIFSIVYSVVLLFLNKKQGLAFWMLFMLTIMDILFITIGKNFALRLTIFLPMFWGMNIANIYNDNNPTRKEKVLLVSIIGYVPILLHFYASRHLYF